jgi:hypothetical protein
MLRNCTEDVFFDYLSFLQDALCFFMLRPNNNPCLNSRFRDFRHNATNLGTNTSTLIKHSAYNSNQRH